MKRGTGVEENLETQTRHSGIKVFYYHIHRKTPTVMVILPNNHIVSDISMHRVQLMKINASKSE